MRAKFKTYRRLSPELRSLCREAFFHLFLAKLLIQFVPSRILLKYLGSKRIDPPLRKEDTTSDPNTFRLIQKGIDIVRCNLPWHSKCLDQAMAAQWMLARRRLSGTVYLGLKKSDSSHKKYDAHAWVCYKNIPVVGAQPHLNYVIVGMYSHQNKI
ncbi:MAG: lasso peptide biosynthesis B2 protein [Chlamydiae bacterium]|nr:lasso peptide biosynthesis B2 protein [Chlamydiota bacterium]MBI3265579.1 lasso peptide biosynthesis B2 protein [Chlamydiota bacterium]